MPILNFKIPPFSAPVMSLFTVALQFIGSANYSPRLHSAQTYAEYIALSMCVCDLLPMHTLLSELSRHYDFGIPSNAVLTQQFQIDTHVHKLTVYKDNTSCMELVNCLDQYCPCTKHVGINCTISVMQPRMEVLWLRRLIPACNLLILSPSPCHNLILISCNICSWDGNVSQFSRTSLFLGQCFLFLHHSFLLHLSNSTFFTGSCA